MNTGGHRPITRSMTRALRSSVGSSSSQPTQQVSEVTRSRRGRKSKSTSVRIETIEQTEHAEQTHGQIEVSIGIPVRSALNKTNANHSNRRTNKKSIREIEYQIDATLEKNIEQIIREERVNYYMDIWMKKLDKNELELASKDYKKELILYIILILVGVVHVNKIIGKVS
ncbi:17960_t:CDS:2 [Funneliformis geosporum]|uniref:17960_t:CDS:1 n=1 Tax=Funneliformis geosporum TaxID=1117311 RepID=A0A9W4SBU5_9GLOM|nr:17960_t:CDS:2 [Funneliformis geosporum]